MSRPVAKYALSILYLLCLLLQSSYTIATPDTQSSALIIFGNNNLPPYEFLENGAPVGANVELWQRIGEQLGRAVDVRLISWPDAQQKLLAGQGDALTLMSATPQRSLRFDFTEPTFSVAFRFFVNTAQLAVFNEHNLSGQRIGVTAGGYPRLWLNDTHPSAQLITVDNHLEGFRALLRGEIDAVALLEWSGYYTLHKHGITSISAKPSPFVRQQVGIAVPKGRPEFVRQLNQAIRQLKHNGQFDKIIDRWAAKKVLLLSQRQVQLLYGLVSAFTLVLILLFALLLIARSRGRRLEKEICFRRKARAQQQLADLVYQHLSEAIMVTDADNRIININPAFSEITGYTRAEVIGQNPRLLSSGQHDEAFFQAMWHDLNNAQTWKGEIWNRRKNGDLFAEQLTINTICDATGKIHRWVALFSDITDKKASEKQIWHHANFDSLTGLPNRRMFLHRLDQEIKKAKRSGLHMALLFLDLDHFKEVNDTLGHAQGDALLQEAAKRLLSGVRETDIVSRPGGDEFTIILSEISDLNRIEQIAGLLLKAITEPFELDQETVYLSTSIGITLYPQDGVNIDNLLKQADQAMYAAKEQGRNSFYYFTPQMQQVTDSRKRLISELRDALHHNELLMHYQPIVRLDSGKMLKAEALLRWQHPTRGLLDANHFINTAEETGLINELGAWAFRDVIRTKRAWQKAGHRTVPIHINVSPLQLRKQDEVNKWFELLAAQTFPDQSITIEITEAVLQHPDTTQIELLPAFQDHGIQVALDHFGTGYSCLTCLNSFNIDYLKIAPSFVQQVKADSSEFILCEAIIVMAHKLGIEVIAEGVETPLQRDLLASIGCDYGQGFLFSPALSPSEFENRLRLTPAQL